MAQWQFLIQKQGDRSWHNLEWPNLQISEGWYRVLARSHLRNTDVEIRITHSLLPELPAQARIEKQLRRTNSEGLIPIIPFTYLQPGILELQCSGNIISNSFSKSWEYGICLQVLPCESTSIGEERPRNKNVKSNLPDHPDAIPDSKVQSRIVVEPQPSDFSTVTPIDNTDINQSVSPVDLKGETAEQILHNLMDLAIPSAETLLDDRQVDETLATKAPTTLSLTLDQENYIAHWGEILVIHGRVERPKQINQESETAYPDILHSLELVIELRSPLASEILTQVRQPLPNSLLPITISSAIDIPVDCESQLILADINLYGSFSEFGEVLLLSSQSFTITADVTQLLEITKAAKFREQNLLDHPITPPKKPESAISIDLGLFNLAKNLQTNHSQSTQISPKQLLPPQLNPIELAVASQRLSQLNKLADSPVPQLPKLPENQINPQTALSEAVGTGDLDTESFIDQEFKDKEKTLAPINLAELIIKHHPLRMLNSTFPYLKRLKVLPAQTAEIPNHTPETLSFEDFEDSPEIDTPELIASDSVAEVSLTPDLELNPEVDLHSSPLLRKWMQSQGYSLPESVIEVLDQQTRADEQIPLLSPSVDINSLSDPEPETEITADDEPLIADTTANPLDIEEMPTLEQPDTKNIVETSSLSFPDVVTTDSDWLAQEFVVEDEYIESSLDVMYSDSSAQQHEDISDLSHTPLLEGSIVEPLPIPQLYVPDGELIAGTSVRVRVELPLVSPEIVVKLWMKDCQTRWLLDDPHLLTDLLPNVLGNLEVTTQLNIPFGCMEILVEAIAYHQTTQQESHKVTVVKNVIPPDLPNFQLDELLGI
ncbi:hypothetical protein VB620_15150 [Nodularia harveyana UHCC-0300]|uniref:Uncharacterized protein n=1 Tax=Nodularia harveyana UHCC-0300 TaxID=2974287 RepID=A0ABU5UHU3_9CYAN|nr:hypothetical protein [Nodularia harveyana]MEA5582675.1 hypothetical protein [Nodularia harveyana UHCC-0300]